MKFWVICATIFSVIFWGKFLWNVAYHMSYNSPGNTERRLDQAFYGRKKQFGIQGNLWSAIICTVFVYCYGGGILW